MAVRILAVLSFVAGLAVIKIQGNIVIGFLVIFAGFFIMMILAFRGQRIQKQAKEMYQNGFLKNALAGILPQYNYTEKMENPDVNYFYQYGLLRKFNHVNVHEILQVQYSVLDRRYNLSATDSQVLAKLSDIDTINLLLELAPLHPIICIKDKTVYVAIHTENRILNYDYKAGFEPHTEYAKIQREMERERRIMNILR